MRAETPASPTTYRAHDIDLVARRELSLAPTHARHHFTIDSDSQRLVGQCQRIDQILHALAVGQYARLAIELYVDHYCLR